MSIDYEHFRNVFAKSLATWGADGARIGIHLRNPGAADLVLAMPNWRE